MLLPKRKGVEEISGILPKIFPTPLLCWGLQRRSWLRFAAAVLRSLFFFVVLTVCTRIHAFTSPAHPALRLPLLYHIPMTSCGDIGGHLVQNAITNISFLAAHFCEHQQVLCRDTPASRVYYLILSHRGYRLPSFRKLRRFVRLFFCKT